MKNIKFYLINFLFWLGGYSVFAQDITNPHTNIGHGKQSPNAKGYSAENVQVNQSTGAAGISLPITSLSSHTLTVPVSLVYQSTGIKVEDKASWVGLGWNLQAGGMITRRVNGRPDEFPSNPQGNDLNNGNYGDKLNGLPNGGYLANSTIIPNEYQSGNISHENIARRTLHGQLDLEPDEFYFNFLGMSGMFVFDENGIAQCIPYQNLKIEKIGLMDGFVIKDYSGYEYYFLAIEKTRTTNSCFNTAAYNSLGTISGWYISEIKNVNGQTEFVFNYEENEDQSTTLSYFEYAKSYVCDNPNSCPPSSQEICTITSKCNMLHLTSIESFHGELKFEKGAEREDLFNDYVLAKIRLFNSSNVNVFNVEFSYDYFLGSQNTKRLRLTSMREVNSLGESLAPTLLSYIDDNLPEHSFKGIDHWGYYNGRNTDTYLLTDPISRHPDPLYTGANMLKSITSPSGSILSFEFEPNSYGTDPNGLVEVTCEEIASADGLEFPQYYWNQAPNTDYFELTAPSRVSVSYNVVQDLSCSASFVKITNESNEVVFHHNEQSQGLQSTILDLPAGNYTVSATKGSNCTNPSFNQSGAWITVSLIPYYAENLGTLIGGGMRIKSISSQESLTGEIAKRNFNYNLFNDMGRSSGYLLTIPYYSYYQQYGHVGFATFVRTLS